MSPACRHQEMRRRGGGRFDCLPWSGMEVWDEQENNASALEVEPHLALRYFYDAYFMGNRRNVRLPPLPSSSRASVPRCIAVIK